MNVSGTFSLANVAATFIVPTTLLPKRELHFELHSWALFERVDRSFPWDDCCDQENNLLESKLLGKVWTIEIEQPSLVPSCCIETVSDVILGSEISLYPDILRNSINDALSLKLEMSNRGVHHIVAGYRKCEESKASYPSSHTEQHNPHKSINHQ